MKRAQAKYEMTYQKSCVLGLRIETRWKLDVLTVNTGQGLLPDLRQNYFQYASSIHGYNTRYASKQNLYKPKERTNCCLSSNCSLG